MKRKIMGLFLAVVLTVNAFLISTRSITYDSSGTMQTESRPIKELCSGSQILQAGGLRAHHFLLRLIYN